MTHAGSPGDPNEEASALRDSSTTTVIGTVSTAPLRVNDRSGPRCRVGFGVDVLHRWYVPRIESYEETTTTVEVRVRGYLAVNVLASLTIGDRVIVRGHLEEGDCGLLQVHADVVALALSDEPRGDSESEAAA
jgi:hypothetical protein